MNPPPVPPAGPPVPPLLSIGCAAPTGAAPVGARPQPQNPAKPPAPDALDLPTEDDVKAPDRSLKWREVPLPAGSSAEALAFSGDGKLIAAAGTGQIYVAS